MTVTCECGHAERLHYEEPLFLRGVAPCWGHMADDGRLCMCMEYRQHELPDAVLDRVARIILEAEPGEP